jgi:ATP-binding protein involved in chromosome partitioning
MMTDQQKQKTTDEELEIRMRMSQIKHKILVLSGKGGVGKSTVAANLAISLAAQGSKVGLLDVDIHGPSIPQLLGVTATGADLAHPDGDPSHLLPVTFNNNLSVMSTAFLVEDRDAALIWRGPMKYGAIKQFLKDVEWGQLDYLVIDSPPGTGDEPLSVAQLVGDDAGAIIVTTPQDLAVSDVRRCVTFCRKLALPIFGVVENMSGFVCPSCGETVDIFKSGGGHKMAAEMGIPFLSQIPIDPSIVAAGDSGTLHLGRLADTEAARAFKTTVDAVLKATEPTDDTNEAKQEGDSMKIAIPVTGGKLAAHFGHCEQFALVDVDKEAKTVTATEMLTPPPHEPGLLPRWLSEKGAQMIIAGGMGGRAQGLFEQNSIKVIVGAPDAMPEATISAYLQGTLETGDNVCDH